MAEAFVYRPKFVDIRVKKPSAKAERDLEERGCDHVGCSAAGKHRAPKSRENNNAYWWFCADHAAEYNRRWNYFEGMNEEQLRAYEASERAGHRPTWTFRSGRGDRLSAAHRAWDKRGRSDPFGIFRGDGSTEPEPARARSLGRLQILALGVLDLEEGATAEQIRARYADLVKRYHPDSNGGDRSVEGLLHKVIRAYQTLKASGIV